MLASNEEIFITVIASAFAMLLLAVVVIIAIVRYKIEQKNNILEIEHLKITYAQEILQTQIEVQNATLQQISEELHDNIGQLLSVAKINLNILEETEQTTENQSYIKQTNEIIGQTIQDVRLLTKSFDGDFVKDFGLEESLSHELLRIRKTNKYQTELLVTGERYSLGYDKEIVLFRIVQEVLNNIMKHARATKIQSQLTYGSEKFIICLKDNGRGFDVQTTENEQLKYSGAGLRNMRRRAGLIGGRLILDTEPGKGTRIEIEVSPV
ncbi:hypothetical protein DYBT9275_01185 [Dyadobacter sp. CECT 9275]|uniref:histidine kinase n=1 Tax=Dyadobacter helix TaxID=2822344 RepID=A0A916JBK2_9BACT|nr:ATP-binding protein [Dyadobacter sp. CECT 9275]CAG4993525.1 hypothetical protein DYBT9275_01185 [Dyadobacter sp. CECT 9275]